MTSPGRHRDLSNGRGYPSRFQLEEHLEQQTVEGIIEEVVNGGAAHTVVTESFQNAFMFYGKSLYEWMAEMSVSIPRDLTPADLRNLWVEIAVKHQRAANYYSIASAIHGGIVSGGETKKSELVSKLIESYATGRKTRPAAQIIERMADSYLTSTIHTRIAARIVKDFWKERRDTLVEIRKCLEQVSIAMHSEMKYQV